MSIDNERPRTSLEIRSWVRERSPQPFRDDEVAPPPTQREWIYGPEQYELALLARLIDEGYAANRHVHYPRNHGRTAVAATFRARAMSPGSMRLRVSGTATATVDGVPLASPSDAEGTLCVEIPRSGVEVEVDVVGTAVVVPALSLPVSALLTGWTSSLEGGTARKASIRRGGDDPPHLEPGGSVTVEALEVAAGVFDVGAPVLGRPILPSGPRPIISTGESIAEALADQSDHESRHDLVELPDGRWTTRHRLGFRYIAVSSHLPVHGIPVVASVSVVPRPGAFACSDDRLTRIWAAAQYTLRVCAQGLLVDGIKRDRMPWAGDQAMSTLANAYALGDGGLVSDGLRALGRPGHGYVNGISDYSLWWLVNTDLYLRYFGDPDFARVEADRVHEFLTDLAAHAGEDAVFRPASQPGGFVDSGPGSVFIDWGVQVEHGRDSVALQMLWYWALGSAERVLARAGHPAAERWAAVREQLEKTLRTRAWVGEPGRWAEYLDAPQSSGRATYANFLALLSGIHEGAPPGVRAAAAHAIAGTPFMDALRLRALLRADQQHQVLDVISATWGSMLDRGPGTFWEEAATGSDIFSMYGRPFGRSLCHAWSSGPAALIPEAVMGVEPLADGWSLFTVRPILGDLEWASIVIPAPPGDIVIVAEGGSVTVDIPAGAALLGPSGHTTAGPATVAWSIPAAAGWAPSRRPLAAP